ncbi:LRR and PYD domains-containing 12-like protein [Labeo rohita]|uniref:LRR and PYD domains-containing 12-like protein n=1 Tax=Labeo rohita TaxID=84645 RepID=A0A498M7L6_LABRO|nr:LRR and PYD domains-containing 12-like protein [Labeo rohita]
MSEMTVMNSLTSDVLGKRPGPKLTVLKHGNGENPFNFRGNENTDSDIRRQFKVIRKLHMQPGVQVSHSTVNKQGCQIKEGVYQLVSSLKDNSYLRKLDLRYNDLGDIGQEILQRERLSLRYTNFVALTFDPQTANDLLYLSENNTKVTRQREKQRLPANDERFDKCNQVLCRQPLIGRCFFIVDVIGRDVHVGVAYFIALTFDSQTANDHLYLKENNTVVTCQTRKQQLPANDERFDKCNQVLCCQPLMGRCFFIVDVTGPVVHVGVACKGIKRKGKGDQVHLGRNKMSWSLRCSKMCEVHHNKHAVSVQSESIRKLGVFVDRNAGSVCFYMLSPQYKLLYMFDADFPEDQELYAAFKIQEPNSSVTLSQESQ